MPKKLSVLPAVLCASSKVHFPTNVFSFYRKVIGSLLNSNHHHETESLTWNSKLFFLLWSLVHLGVWFICQLQFLHLHPSNGAQSLLSATVMFFHTNEMYCTKSQICTVPFNIKFSLSHSSNEPVHANVCCSCNTSTKIKSKKNVGIKPHVLAQNQLL